MQVEELVKSKLEKPKKLLQLAAREWREIDDNTLVFGRPAAEVAELKRISKSDLISFFEVGSPLRSPAVPRLQAADLKPAAARKAACSLCRPHV